MKVGRVAQPAAGSILVAHPAETVRRAIPRVRFFGRCQAGSSLFQKSVTTRASKARSAKESPYWNPRHEPMPRAQIEALQLRKLKNLVVWTQAPVTLHAARLMAGGVTADSSRTV